MVDEEELARWKAARNQATEEVAAKAMSAGLSALIQRMLDDGIDVTDHSIWAAWKFAFLRHMLSQVEDEIGATSEALALEGEARPPKKEL